MTRFPEGQCFPDDVCVVRPVLDRLAAAQPDKVFVRFLDGSSWTYREFRDIVVRTAVGFQSIGANQGDHVLLWLPNGAAMLRAIFALNYLGAVCVPINTAQCGQLLEHVVANSDARVMVVHADLAARLRDISLHQLKTLVVPGDSSIELPSLEIVPLSTLDTNDGEFRPLERTIKPWNTQSIIHTSGTTGPFKGVLSSYMHAYSSVGPKTWTCVTSEDRFLINLPMFHIGDIFICHAVLCAGGSIAMIERFFTDLFWDEVRKTGASVAFLLGSMTSFLLQRPVTGRDRNHPLRRVFLVPLLKGAAGFGERFGVETYTLFNMTEIAMPTISGPNTVKPGGCGKAREGVDIRLVDQHDCKAARGEIGEMVIRTQRPRAINHGYHRAPEATASAWRNGWFHASDAFCIDADDDYMFVDRLKDVIRRRGENISSAEVEAELLAYPGVREAAAVPVPSEFGEDEVMAAVALLPGQPPLDFTEFIGFLSTRLPHFMALRFVRVQPELPKTPTAKVTKAVLRKDGITVDTQDRVEAGVQVKRERLNQPDISMNHQQGTEPMPTPVTVITFYSDYKSPYAFVAKAGAYQLEQDYDVTVQWLPYTLNIQSYLGSVELRSEHHWRRVRYSYMDARRLANIQSLTLRGPKKIYDSRLANVGMLYALEQDAFRRYNDLVFERFWKRELEIDEFDAIVAVLEEAGADTGGFRSFVDGPEGAAHDRIVAEAEEAGIFGVPMFVLDGELFWGGDRLPLLREILDARGLARAGQGTQSGLTHSRKESI